jgi:hypothetical protein
VAFSVFGFFGFWYFVYFGYFVQKILSCFGQNAELEKFRKFFEKTVAILKN